MKFFDTDWNMILQWLKVWEKLSPATRRYYLEAKSHAQSVSAEGYGNELPLALSLGLVESVSSGRIKPTKASAPFRSVMFQLAKWPLFDGKPDRQQLNDYLKKHFTADEFDTLNTWNQPGWDSPRRLEGFLAAQKVADWEQPFLSYHERSGGQRLSGWGWGVEEERSPKTAWFANKATVETAKHLLRLGLESKRPWALQALLGELPEQLRPAVDPALKACLRHGLLFAALDKASFELLIGVCPFTLHMANRLAPVPPAVQKCTGVLGVPFHIEDMTQVLVLAASDECLLNRNDERQFFKSVETRLREDFVALPQWLTGADFHMRLNAATAHLLQLRFVTDTYQKEAKRQLKATPAGRRWLGQSLPDRIREILFESQRLWKDEDWEDEEVSSEDYYSDPYDTADLDDYEDEDEPGLDSGKKGSSGKPNLLAWQKSVWRQAPVEECVSLSDFLDYHARVSATDSGAVRGRAHDDELTQEELRRERLENFFWRALVPCGCVEAAGQGPQDLRFRLSSAGQYLVGLKRSIPCGPANADARVVVQPNFEIVFLGPDLGAEVAMAAFAERCGRNAGTLFRLTRAKMILAASRGVTAEGALAALGKFSSKPVPENVAAEVKAWFASCRSLTIRHSTLLQTPDEETALRTRQLLGASCGQLSPTLLEWPDQQLPSKLITKLRESGVFLETDSPKTPGQPGG
jgi:hypothetical protein